MLQEIWEQVNLAHELSKNQSSKTTRAWVPFQESLDEFPLPVIPLAPLKKAFPTSGLVPGGGVATTPYFPVLHYRYHS